MIIKRLLKIISILFLLFVTHGAIATEVDDYINDGIKFYDIGNFEKAIQKYNLALELEPSNYLALYELALTYMASKKYEECVVAASKGLENQTDLVVKLTTILGSCHSQLGNKEKAIEVYKGGFLIDPSDASLHLNIAVTYSSVQQDKEAISHLKEAIIHSTNYATPYYFIAEIYRTNHYQIPAMYFYMQFILMEPNTLRSEDAARKIFSLLYQGIKLKENGDVDIIVNSESPKDEGDFSTLQLALSLSATASTTEEAKKSKTDAERHTEALTSFVQICNEIEDGKLVSTFTWLYAVQNMIALQNSSDFNTYSYILAEMAGMQGAGNWFDKNQPKIEKMTNATSQF